MQSKMSRAIFMVLTAFLCSIGVSNAQSNVSELSLEVSVDLSQPVVNFDTLYSLKVVVQLSDTINIETVNIKVGATLHSSDFFSGKFDFNTLTGPEGTAITRRGYTVELTVGTIHSGAVYFYEATTTDFQGNTANPFIKQL